MLNTISQLMHFKARAGDDHLKVTDIFFDFGTRRIEYVSLDIGGWFDRKEVLIHAAEFGTPDTVNEEWPVRLDRAAVENAPHWHDDAEDNGSIFDIENWPPLVVGPFGTTFSPLLLNAQSHADAEEAAAIEGHRAVPLPMQADDVDPDPQAAQDESEREEASHMARASAWLGRKVYGNDGELGDLDDIVVNVERGVLTHLSIAGGGLLSPHGAVAPFDWMRHVVRDSHIVMGLASSQLDSAPGLRDDDALSPGWQDRVQRHYTPAT